MSSVLEPAWWPHHTSPLSGARTVPGEEGTRVRSRFRHHCAAAGGSHSIDLVPGVSHSGPSPLTPSEDDQAGPDRTVAAWPNRHIAECLTVN